MKGSYFIAIVLLGLGIATGIVDGWLPDISRIVFAAAIALIIAFRGVFQSSSVGAVVSPLSVQEEIHRVDVDPQPRQLRHLIYEVAADWPNERGDDGVYTGVKFFVDQLRLILRVGVSPIIDQENTTPLRIQAFAKNHYENELGMKVIRNEIGTFAGHWCVVTDAVNQRGGVVRRYSFSTQLSEYTFQFTFGTMEQFHISQPLIDELVHRCRLVTPRLVERPSLGGRVSIGVPPWCDQIVDQDRYASWRGRPIPLEFQLHLIDDEGIVPLNETVFCRLREDQSTTECIFRRVQLEDNGIAGLAAIWQDSQGKTTQRITYAVRLPNGLLILLDTDYKGIEKDLYEGFNNVTVRLAILGSLQPGGVSVM